MMKVRKGNNRREHEVKIERGRLRWLKDEGKKMRSDAGISFRSLFIFPKVFVSSVLSSALHFRLCTIQVRRKSQMWVRISVLIWLSSFLSLSKAQCPPGSYGDTTSSPCTPCPIRLFPVTLLRVLNVQEVLLHESLYIFRISKKK